VEQRHKLGITIIEQLANATQEESGPLGGRNPFAAGVANDDRFENRWDRILTCGG